MPRERACRPADLCESSRGREITHQRSRQAVPAVEGRLGLHDEKDRWLERAEQLADAAGDTFTLARCLQARAVGAVRRKQWDTAITLERGAVAACEKGGHHALRAVSLANLGHTLASRGEREEARHCLDETLGFLDHIDDERGVTDVIEVLCWEHARRREWEALLEQRRRAVSIHHRAGRTRGMSTTLVDLAIELWTQGRVPEAAATAAEALELVRREGDVQRLAYRLWLCASFAFDDRDGSAEPYARELDSLAIDGSDKVRGFRAKLSVRVAAAQRDLVALDRALDALAELRLPTEAVEDGPVAALLDAARAFSKTAPTRAQALAARALSVLADRRFFWDDELRRIARSPAEQVMEV